MQFDFSRHFKRNAAAEQKNKKHRIIKYFHRQSPLIIFISIPRLRLQAAHFNQPLRNLTQV